MKVTTERTYLLGVELTLERLEAKILLDYFSRLHAPRNAEPIEDEVATEFLDKLTSAINAASPGGKLRGGDDD